MRRIRGWVARCGCFFNKQRKAQEFDQEIASHLAFQIEDNLRAGMAPAEARRQAILKLGGIEPTKEAHRDQRGLPWLETFLQDLRFGARQLRKNPSFTAVAVFTLALGIGANVAVFGLAKAVLFRPLGFENPDRMMWVRMANTSTGTTDDRLSWREMQDILESTSLESLATFGVGDALWEHDGATEATPGLRVTPGLAEVLRVRPVLGRTFLPDDAKEGAAAVVMISHEFWQTRFAGSPSVLGQSVRLENKPHEIVGVLPPDLEFPLERAPSAGTGSVLRSGPRTFWLPMGIHGEDRVSRAARMFLPVGRLKPGVPEETVRAELAALGQRLAADHPETNRYLTFELLSFRDQFLGRTGQAMPILVAAVAAVLLICCVHLANLLLARGVVRQRELAVRVALGAGRVRIVQALMMESSLLAVFGGALGIALATGLLRGIRVLGVANVPFVREAALDGTALLFTGGLSLATVLLFGLWPALRQSRVEGNAALRSGNRTTDSLPLRLWQRGLQAAQIAVVMVLVTAAGLLLESFRRLTGQDLGYKPEQVWTVDVDSWGMESNAAMCQLYRRIHARLSALPGVEAVGTSSSAPLTGKWTFDEKAQVVGEPKPEADRPSLAAGFIAFDYFRAMGIPLLSGRFFHESELKDDGYGRLVILNQAAADVLFPGRSAIGGRFTVGSNPDRILEVIGVVKDTRDVRLEEKPQPRFYWQYAFGGAEVVVRSTLQAETMLPWLRDILQQADHRIIIREIRPMTAIVAGTVAERRFLMALVTGYALVALGIAAIGLFGVMAYQVAQRTGEFGVRLALGSSRAGLARLVLRQAATVIAAGILAGLFISLGTNRLLGSQLYGLSPHDPALLAGVSILLVAIATLASYLPARRAAKVEPMVALRCE